MPVCTASMNGFFSCMIKKCLKCNREFRTKPSLVRRGWGKYCSISCGLKKKVQRRCEICGIEFGIVPSKVAKGWGKYCGLKCRGIAHTKNFKKEINCSTCKKTFVTARPLTQKYCSKKCFTQSTVGISRSQRIKDAISKANKGRKNPWLSQYAKSNCGVKNPNWRGGTSKRAQKRVNTSEWKVIRDSVYKRDNWTCQRCYLKLHRGIQCHHRVPWEVSHDDSIKNLVTLCVSCHSKVEWEYKKFGKVFDLTK